MDHRKPVPPEVPVAMPANVPVAAPEPAAAPRISSRALLAGAKEVLIEHNGTLYRLRQTTLGKLILTK